MEEYVFKTLSADAAKDVIDAVNVSNERYSAIQFQKYMICDDDYEWLCEYYNGRPVAMCVLKHDFPTEGFLYVSMIQSFESGHGYGKRLLEHVLQKSDRVWLMKMPGASESLHEFYKSVEPKLEEMCVWSGALEAQCVMFSQGCDVDDLQSVIS